MKTGRDDAVCVLKLQLRFLKAQALEIVYCDINSA